MATRYKIEGLERYVTKIRDGLSANGGTNNPVKQAFLKWAFIYRTFLFRRFVTNSRGGGDWQPLSPATIRSRRHGKGQTKITGSGGKAIMVNTGILKNVLDPRIEGATPGRVEKIIKDGIAVGFGGTKRHPGANFTIGQIAYLQHHGNGAKLPPRPIMVRPDNDSRQQMVSIMRDALREVRG